VLSVIVLCRISCTIMLDEDVIGIRQSSLE